MICYLQWRHVREVTTSGPRQYVKLVESYRDAGGVPRQRVIATLGRLEAIRTGEADALVNGLLRAAGKPTLEEGTGEIDFAPARSVGDTRLLMVGGKGSIAPSHHHIANFCQSG